MCSGIKILNDVPGSGEVVELYVAFLSQRPRNKPKFPFASSKEGLEAIAMRGQEVFVVSRPKKN
jgi:hypothetical protein